METVLGVSRPFQQHPNRENEETLEERRVEYRSVFCSSERSELWREGFSCVWLFKRGFMSVRLSRV